MCKFGARIVCCNHSTHIRTLNERHEIATGEKHSCELFIFILKAVGVYETTSVRFIPATPQNLHS